MVWEPAEAFADSGDEFLKPQAIVDVHWQFPGDMETNRLAVDLTGKVTPEGLERLILQSPAGAIQVHIPTRQLWEFCEWVLEILEGREG